MSKFHISFKEEKATYYSRGENFDGVKAEDAIAKFRTKYPTAVFVNMTDLDALYGITGKTEQDIDATINIEQLHAERRDKILDKFDHNISDFRKIQTRF